MALLVGTVVGVGIFKAPALVAASSGSATDFLLLWGAGALVSLIGALCYAELATTQSDAGGEYSILTRAWGGTVGFLFAWGRLAVIQTGAIAAVAFVFGDYAQELAPLGPFGASVYAAASVTLLTVVNLRGAVTGARTQAVLTGALVLGTAVLAVSALLYGGTPPDPAASGGGATVAGMAMIFVLLTYGGWNEAAYLAGELRDVRRGMVRVLVIGIGAVAALYLTINLAYVSVLGLDRLAGASTVAIDLAGETLGGQAGQVVGLLVALATLSTVNATIFTGARASYALGRDYPRFGFLGRWDGGRDTPGGALLVQGMVALLLIVLGTPARDSFAAMVEFTAPAFWLFLLMTGLALFRFRAMRLPAAFRVPLYPLTPIAFCLACLFMLHASLAHTGIGALFGVLALAAGVPALVWARRLPSGKGARTVRPPA
ncbi:amino acid permease [Rhodospirillum centenum]|uniref:amino acid permease n=1 Tax=Rhodospirillum centenum TaxID=34018 RepID=UPI00179B6A9E|nr:amino acid permease [Rhodospirillum centenum]